MSDEKIKIIEKKIDLLYRMNFDDNINFRDNLDEFISLFNLSIEMGKMGKIVGLITVKVKELFEKGEEIENKLNKLKSDYEAGNFLAKEKEKTRMSIYHQEEKYKALLEIGKYYRIVKNGEEELHEILLMINLKEKLGIKLLEEDDYHTDFLKIDFEHKEEIESKLKEDIEWLQERIKEYKKEFK